ncbi:hypothetical protein E2C01_052210 [Portunus trituberculatus]|uniref:Uncharacterized protein n=1 Tax=Portunus trituberculatus TaxID=210409 RepID=A0A5B7GNS5_PORTR|nr:hypothetical protein [Portunus trituberculatus]
MASHEASGGGGGGVVVAVVVVVVVGEASERRWKADTHPTSFVRNSDHSVLIPKKFPPLTESGVSSRTASQRACEGPGLTLRRSVMLVQKVRWVCEAGRQTRTRAQRGIGGRLKDRLHLSPENTSLLHDRHI